MLPLLRRIVLSGWTGDALVLLTAAFWVFGLNSKRPPTICEESFMLGSFALFCGWGMMQLWFRWKMNRRT
jgi:hypothetical protein